MSLPEDHAGHMAGGLTEFSLRRRITVLVLLLSILVVGVVATIGIPLEIFPRGYTGPYLHVWVPWPNAPTQEVLDEITFPLEEELSSVRGLSRVNSFSTVNGCSVFIQFKQGTDMNVAYREVRDRVQRARVLFPEDVDRVFIGKEDASGIPVAVIGMAIDPGLTDYYTLLKREVIQPLERIDGVAKVTVDGLEEKEFLIEVDRELAEGNGLNLYQLAQELGADNFTLASGHVRDAGRKWLLRSVATYNTIEEVENRRLTPTVRLKDVARVKYDEPEKRYSVRVNSRPAVAVVIFKEGEANTVEVSRRIQRAFEEMQQNPRLSTMYFEVLFNQGAVVIESLMNLVNGGLLGGFLAAAILFLFLRRFRLTAIITLSIPLSLLIALAVMYFAGESLNILTLLALMIAIGMLVDNSIVVAENIHRFHKEGLPRREACIRGAAEIALAITMATLTTVVVFLPVSLVEGEGRFFLARLALPISVSLLASLLVALVFVPLSVYLTLPTDGMHQRASLLRWSHERVNAVLRHVYELTFERLNTGYNHALAFFLTRRLELVLLLGLVFALTQLVAFRKVRFVEQQEADQTSFQIRVQSPPEYSLDELREYFGEIEKVLAARQEEYGFKGYFTLVFPRGGNIEAWFDKDREMKLSAKAIGEKLLKELPRKPGMKLFTGRENRAEETKGQEVFVFQLEGDEAAILDEVAERLEPLVLNVEGVLGIRESEQPAPSEMGLVIDRDRATASAVSPEMIAGLVGYALRGMALPKFNYEGREIPVRIRFEERDRTSFNTLVGFQVPTANGGTIPLSAVTQQRMLKTPKAIFRANKRTTRTITAELKPDRAKEARERLMALQQQIDLPEGVTFGTSQIQTVNEELRNMAFAAGLSIIFIYLLMGFLFESFVLPLSIILTIPLAGLGVVWAHFAAGKDLDYLGAVGAVLLIGVVVNNAIVLIDYVIRLRAEGVERREALLLAAHRRFRPIMMTALTTIIGMIPLTFQQPSDIGLSYKSFGLTLIGGMTTATALTMLVVPVFYTFFDDAREALSRVVHRVMPPRKTAALGLEPPPAAN
ncbi:MAG: efflux RND transporter permease subunit [Bryobacteraceae bacterium]|nr:efflux RND transporter permease subunit [Bryobacteraceae bacterium]